VNDEGYIIIMENFYDVVIAGGSISGLMAARELASHDGISVLVLEEDYEIGSPEHCGGLVSMNGMQNLGILPSSRSIENKIKKARILSHSRGFDLSAENQKVIVLNRREFDKQIAFQAQDLGAEIKINCSVKSIMDPNKEQNKNGNRGTLNESHFHLVSTTDGETRCRYFIDARGVGSIIHRNRYGILQSAQYEVYAPWIDGDTIEVQFDNKKFPGFFAWIIPTDSRKGKVGVAGRSINAAKTLTSYMDRKGPRYTVVRKVYSPIWVTGPLESFIVGKRSIVIGDAAGQTKPTTAGGIYTCGMGGMLAGISIANAIAKRDDNILKDYETSWFSLFKAEFTKMLLARRIFERLDNSALDGIFSSISELQIKDISKSGDFDFHSAAVSRIVGAKSATKIIRSVLGNEIRRIFD
jgi:digeranylgeranylglycerophospholipid reductase